MKKKFATCFIKIFFRARENSSEPWRGCEWGYLKMSKFLNHHRQIVIKSVRRLHECDQDTPLNTQSRSSDSLL